jgi:EAL domain-containing protein (putative c-di-GMP-specific phosphodiesterase class I)
VRTIIALADSLSLRTVAEGIEDCEQHARLCDLGCTLGQGYLFARPLGERYRSAPWRHGACGLSRPAQAFDGDSRPSLRRCGLRR